MNKQAQPTEHRWFDKVAGFADWIQKAPRNPFLSRAEQLAIRLQPKTMDAFFCFFRWASPPTWHHLFLRLRFQDDDNRSTQEAETNAVGDAFLVRLASHIDHLHESSFGGLDKMTIQSFLALMRQMYYYVYVPGVHVQGVKVNFGVMLSKLRLFGTRLQMRELAEKVYDQAFQSVYSLAASHTTYNNRADAATFMATFINDSAMDGDDCAILKKYVTFLPAIPSL